MIAVACRRYVFLSLLLFSGACGYAVESTYQNVTFVTPGTQDARCFAYVNKRKYQAYPPQTLNIKKSHKDMKVDCHAPGNRKIALTVPSKVVRRSFIAGPAGVAWDYVSDSLYYYPSVIAIDFSQTTLQPNSPPKYNNSDIAQPESYDLEEIQPSQPLLNADKHKIKAPILRRGGDYPADYIGEDMGDTGYISPEEDEKANIRPVTEEALESPAPLYPGE